MTPEKVRTPKSLVMFLDSIEWNIGLKCVNTEFKDNSLIIDVLKFNCTQIRRSARFSTNCAI